MAISGVLLNHAERLAISGSFVPEWIAGKYFTPELHLTGVVLGEHQLVEFDGRLLLDGSGVTFCDGGLLSAVSIHERIIVLCGSDLILLDSAGQLEERISLGQGFAADVDALAVSTADTLVIRSAGRPANLALDTLTLQPSSFTGSWLTSGEVLISQADLPGLLHDAITWEQFLLDLHSGAFFGLPGILFSDVLALIIVVMVLSGFVMAANPRRAGRCPSGDKE